jgi:hypothetical protein
VYVEPRAEVPGRGKDTYTGKKAEEGIFVLGLAETFARRWRRRRQTVRRHAGLADLIELRLNGLYILLKRRLGLDWPHEIHILVPRAEFIKTYQNGRLVEERTVLSSISIVHAPYHPPAEGGGPPGPPPAPPVVPPHRHC